MSTPKVKKDLGRLEAANKIMPIIGPADSRIEVVNNYLWVSWFSSWEGKAIRKRWHMRSGSSWYPTWYNKWPAGGTSMVATAQLIRWIKDEPVYSLRAWRHWCSDSVKLLQLNDLKILEDAGYPKEMTCVLCDKAIAPGDAFDWWDYDGKSGPCCYHGDGCRQIKK